jgi:phosphoribosyl 1,2-cyclic phosphodiesterase
MALSIASLNSGSNGNCYYVSNGQDAILVDAGLSCRETERRMERLGLSMENVRAIFISHEHDDHIRGTEVLSRRYHLPVHISEATLSNGHLRLDSKRVVMFGDLTTVCIGDMEVTPFSKTHDASDPYSFLVACAGIRVGIFTDIGTVCDNVIRHFMQCHAAFLEANYDEQMLEEGRYPYSLKNRIRGGQGHLSNRQALELFVAYRPAYMSHLLLSHLSQDNNRPELVQALFGQEARGTQIVVASRHVESGIFDIDGSYVGAAGPYWNPLGQVSIKPAPVSPPQKRDSIPDQKRRRRGRSGNGASPLQTSLFNDEPC